MLDSSVLIAAERQAQPISDLLVHIQNSIAASDIVISAVSILELEHGLWRASSDRIRETRRLYLDEVYASIPVQPFTAEIAKLAARIDAQTRAAGVAIPFADLQIGTTALELGYAMVTLNPRHFRMIPGLEVRGL